jgi:hypothetical protein
MHTWKVQSVLSTLAAKAFPMLSSVDDLNSSRQQKLLHAYDQYVPLGFRLSAAATVNNNRKFLQLVHLLRWTE